ncbi:hypothetical protein RI054_33g130310 [Pseudoscourfieldia marina]
MAYSNRQKKPAMSPTARSELEGFFAGRNMLHGQRPREGTVPELDAIMEKHDLNGDQVSRCLRNWRDARQLATCPRAQKLIIDRDKLSRDLKSTTACLYQTERVRKYELVETTRNGLILYTTNWPSTSVIG